MEKLSSEDVREVLVEIPEVIRSLVTENQGLKEKVAGYERKVQAERIATLMDEKGYDSATPYREKVAELLNDPDRDLRVTEEAVRMDVPSVKLASVSEDHPGNGASQLESFILGG
jgi:hypothetical protein